MSEHNRSTAQGTGHGTKSVGQSNLTALQLLILRTIHQHGPQSDMGLWSQLPGESLTGVVIATATLDDDNFIERAPANKIPQRYPASSEMQYWQLTQKGQKHITALLRTSSNPPALESVTQGG